jgi:hypothetical protein
VTTCGSVTMEEYCPVTSDLTFFLSVTALSWSIRCRYALPAHPYPPNFSPLVQFFEAERIYLPFDLFQTVRAEYLRRDRYNLISRRRRGIWRLSNL